MSNDTLIEIAEAVAIWERALSKSKIQKSQIEADIHIAEREIYRLNKRYKEALEKELKRIE